MYHAVSSKQKYHINSSCNNTSPRQRLNIHLISKTDQQNPDTSLTLNKITDRWHVASPCWKPVLKSFHQFLIFPCISHFPKTPTKVWKKHTCFDWVTQKRERLKHLAKCVSGLISNTKKRQIPGWTLLAMSLYDIILGSTAALCRIFFPGVPNRGMLTKKCDDEYLHDLEGWPASGQKNVRCDSINARSKSS